MSRLFHLPLEWSTLYEEICRGKKLLLEIRALGDHRTKHHTGQSAGYLEPLIKTYHPSRALRSSSRSLLSTPAIKSKTYGGRAFSTVAPQLWNTIPELVSKMQTALQKTNNNLYWYSLFLKNKLQQGKY